MNRLPYTTLTINGQTYDKLALVELIETKTNLPTWQQSCYHFIKDWLSEEAYVEVQTSGSTGTPKRIRLEKVRMVNSAKMTGRYFNFSKGQKALLCLPCDYIAGKMMVVRAFVWGLDLHLVAPAGNPMSNNKEQFAFAAMVPMQVTKVLEESPEQLEQITQLIIGGGKVGQALYKELQNLSTQCYATYGMTETITHIAIQKLNGVGQSDYFEALPAIQLSLDNRGCLVIDAPNVAIEQVITNDIVQLEADKFKWLGRFDNVINSGGVKVFPEQIEKKLEKIVKVRFFISYLPDEKLGQKVILILEDSQWNDLQITDYQLETKKVLTKYEQAKALYFIDNFAETPTGKIQRNRTKALLKLS